MICRTCLRELEGNSGISLRNKIGLDKTVEEIVILFIPNMVQSNLVDNIICGDCVISVHIFTKFIERAIEVNNTLKEQIQQMEQRTEKAIPLEIDWEDALDELPNQSRKAILKPNKNSTINSNKVKLTVIPEARLDRSAFHKKVAPSLPKEVFVIPKPAKTYSRKSRASTEPKKMPSLIVNSMSCNTNQLVESRELPTITVYEKRPKQISNMAKDMVENILSGKSTETSINKSNHNNKNSEDIATRNSRENKPLEEVKLTNSDDGDHENTNNKEDTSSKLTISSQNSAQVPPVVVDLNESSDSTEDTTFLNTDLTDSTIKKPLITSEYLSVLGLSNNRVISFQKTNADVANILKQFSKMNMNVFKINRFQDTPTKRILLLGTAFCHCPECKILFTASYPMRRHFRVAHPNMPLPIENTKHFNVFVTKKATPFVHRCSKCATYFDKYEELFQHLCDVHKTTPPIYRCKLCRQGYFKKLLYIRHMKNAKIYKNCNMQKCRICKEVISTKKLKKHYYTSHEQLKCHICQKIYFFRNALQKHIRYHPKPTVKTKKRDFLCPICGKLYQTCKKSVHMLSHSQERNFPCDMCSKAFKTLYRLRVHKKIVHTDYKYECLHCGIKTKTKSTLAFHMKVKHLKNYTITCYICGKGFARDDYYKRHLNEHFFMGNEVLGRLVSCKYCKKEFKSATTFRMHLINIHKKKSLNLKCQYCNRTFVSKKSFLSHSKKHKNSNLSDAK